MSKHVVGNVPRYFDPNTNDCFQNAISSCLLYLGFDPQIVLADYLSFIYDRENGSIGLNYFYNPYLPVDYTEELLNSSLEFIYYPKPLFYEEKDANIVKKGKINIIKYLEHDSAKADERLKALLDRDIPVAVGVDLYYLNYHLRYLKEHGFQHSVIITGYDEEKQCFMLFDQYKLLNCDFDGELPMADIHLARNSDNPQHNPLVGTVKQPIINVWTEIEAASDFEISPEKLASVIKESCARMSGAKEILGKKCGVEMIGILKTDLLQKKETGFQDFDPHKFRTYYMEAFKYISRSRLRFKTFMNKLDQLLPPELIGAATASLDEAATNWDILANLSLKLAISKVKVMVVDEMGKHLGLVIDAENRLIENLSQYLDEI